MVPASVSSPAALTFGEQFSTTRAVWITGSEFKQPLPRVQKRG